MHLVRSILWIGSGERFAAELVNDSPTLDVVWERSVEGALRLPLGGFDALVLDAADAASALPGLAALRRRLRRQPLLVRLDARDASAIPELLAAGAGDVLLRTDGDPGELVERLDRLVRDRAGPAARPSPAPPIPEIVGASPQMTEVFALVECASRTLATVLVTGETGTGKELIARAVHRLGPRREQPFVAINCAAFPETLLESELFGHVRGAFTGADREKKGLFEVADSGTLFLDEVSETSAPFQAKLLRALQEREIRPVGGARSRRVDVRVIAATNRDLWAQATGGRFREDLYYRLAVFPIHVPPLRERSGDVAILAEHFLALHGPGAGRAAARLARDALRLLQAWHWPGNVRELENEIQRALALAGPDATLTPTHFSKRLYGVLEPIQANPHPEGSLRATLARIEAWLIRRALDAHGGRRAETARHLELTREGLYKKMKRYGIE
jgi:transcriptional regulator with GAF, ATPase, and Fis domain